MTGLDYAPGHVVSAVYLPMDLGDKTVRYEPSPYHKRTTTFEGPPRHRPDARKCPESIDAATAQEWLADAIRNDLFELVERGLPKHVYYAFGGQLYMARLTNRGQGVYHGHPAYADDVPVKIRRRMRELTLISEKEYRALL